MIDQLKRPAQLQGLDSKSAKVIAFAGNSCTGKSTMARLLAPHVQAQVFIEPEEMRWSLVAQKWNEYSPSAALLAMRNIWIPMFIDADKLRKQGTSSIIDTYFLKIDGYYIGKPHMDWLVPSNDPYIDPLKQIFLIDQTHFPDADCVILFDISFEDWQQFVKTRHRQWDTEVNLAKTYEPNKKYIAQATIDHCKKNNIRLLHFTQVFGDPHAQAERLKELLIAEKII